MTINFTMLAQNSTHDYVKQAYLCALSIRATNPDSKICLITNNTLDEKTVSVFDDIVEIPWEDSAEDSNWKIENRWKIYHACPYDRTIILDTDVLVLDNIELWWNYLKNHKVFFTTNVLTYSSPKTFCSPKSVATITRTTRWSRYYSSHIHKGEVTA